MSKKTIIKSTLLVLLVSVTSFSLMSSEKGKSPIEKYREYVLNLPQDKIEIKVEDELDFYIIRGVYNFNKKEANDLGILLVLKTYHNNLIKWNLDSDII